MFNVLLYSHSCDLAYSLFARMKRKRGEYVAKSGNFPGISIAQQSVCHE
jgi:hypothetical protein